MEPSASTEQEVASREQRDAGRWLPAVRRVLPPARYLLPALAVQAAIVVLAGLLLGMNWFDRTRPEAGSPLPAAEHSVKLEERAAEAAKLGSPEPILAMPREAADSPAVSAPLLESPEPIAAAPWVEESPELIASNPWPDPGEPEVIGFEPWIEPEAAERIAMLPRVNVDEAIEQIRFAPWTETAPETIMSDPQVEEPNMKAMTRVGLQAFFAGWLMAAPAPAQAEDPKNGEVADLLDKINKNLSQLPGMKAQLDSLEKKLADLERVPTQIEDNNKAVKDAIAEIKRLSDDLAKLQTEVAKLQGELQRHRAFSPPDSIPPPKSTPKDGGQIELINAWSTPMVVIIDGEIHRLMPNERRVVARPAGEFRYEVLGVRGLTTRNIAAGKTFTIKIEAQ